MQVSPDVLGEAVLREHLGPGRYYAGFASVRRTRHDQAGGRAPVLERALVAVTEGEFFQFSWKWEHWVPPDATDAITDDTSAATLSWWCENGGIHADGGPTLFSEGGADKGKVNIAEDDRRKHEERSGAALRQTATGAAALIENQKQRANLQKAREDAAGTQTARTHARRLFMSGFVQQVSKARGGFFKPKKSTAEAREE